MLVLKMTRSCVLGAGRKAKVHEVLTVELELAMRLLREKSAVLVGPADDETEEADADAVETEDEGDDTEEADAWEKPVIDNDLVVAETPPAEKRHRRKKG